jgi:hypothetical protein
MAIINLTPHPLNLVNEEGASEEIPSSGVARLGMTTRPLGRLCGYALTQTEPVAVTGLPLPLPGIVYVVSALVAQAVPDREDVVSPDMGPSAVRDDEGRIVAVRGFARFGPPL